MQEHSVDDGVKPASPPSTTAIPLLGASEAEAACLGQRDRNRRETWRSIHRAAFELVEERGFEAATVEQIAERAGVSRRTLFNYFGSKEDAVLGLVPVHCPDEALASFRAERSDPFRATIKLLISILRATFPRATSMPERRRIAQASPLLEERVSAQIRAAEMIVGDVLAHELDVFDPQTALPDGIRRDDAARALIIFSGGVMKYVALTEPGALFDDDADAVDRAIDVFQFVLKETL